MTVSACSDFAAPASPLNALLDTRYIDEANRKLGPFKLEKYTPKVGASFVRREVLFALQHTNFAVRFNRQDVLCGRSAPRAVVARGLLER